jgi:diacylglycerol O-acyltransferase-1
MKEDEDIGRPLTNNPHLSHINSPLEGENYMNQNYRGFLNLIILALVVSHLRLMYENYLKYGILISPKNIYSFISEPNNFVYLTASFALIFSSIFLTFLIEKALGRYKNNVILKLMHFANLSFLLIFPVYMHKYKIVNPGKIL